MARVKMKKMRWEGVHLGDFPWGRIAKSEIPEKQFVTK